MSGSKMRLRDLHAWVEAEKERIRGIERARELAEGAGKLSSAATIDLAKTLAKPVPAATGTSWVSPLEITVSPMRSSPPGRYVARISSDGTVEAQKEEQPAPAPAAPQAPDPALLRLAQQREALEQRVAQQAASLAALWRFVEERGLMSDAVAFCDDEDVAVTTGA